MPDHEPDPNHEAWTGDLKLADTSQETIDMLRAQIRAGRPWYPALLEAVAHWSRSEEVVEGRFFRYLIGMEAFDWLLLAERLLLAVSDLVPEESQEALLFFNRPPEELENEEFRQRIGAAKYRAHLNYLYGVMLEEALQLSVEQEIQKEQRGRAWKEDPSTVETMYHRIYAEPLQGLLKAFWAEKSTDAAAHSVNGEAAFTWPERKEFTYWLFKFRLNRCDRARVASDTRKALNELNRHWAARRRREQARAPEPPDLLDLRPLGVVTVEMEGPPSAFASSSN